MVDTPDRAPQAWTAALHRARAVGLLDAAYSAPSGQWDTDRVAAAQVHATLALTAPETATSSPLDGPDVLADVTTVLAGRRWMSIRELLDALDLNHPAIYGGWTVPEAAAALRHLGVDLDYREGCPVVRPAAVHAARAEQKAARAGQGWRR